jgi:nonribosomal peptide synthetase MxcG
MEDLGGTVVDLAQGPLFAQSLFKAADDRWFWYQRIHHIAMDGFGYSLIARRVADLYTTLVEGRPCEGGAFAPLRPVIDEDLAYSVSEKFTRARDSWMERSADRPVGLTSRRAPFGPGFIRSTAHLPQPSLEALAAAAVQAGVQWPEALTAVTAAFLHRETRASDIVLGMPVMGRLGSASLRVPCMVMNIVPLRVKVDPALSLSKLMGQVAEQVRRSRPHQRYRHEQIRRDWKLLNGERRLFGPVINIMPFDYHLRFGGHAAIAHNLSAGPVEDLCIAAYARSDGNGLRIDFDANPACYDTVTLAGHQSRFLEFLTAATAAPERAIGREAPRCVVLDGGPLLSPAHAVVDLIMARVRVLPDAVALIHGDRSMTYDQLADEAGRIAARLIERGAGPGRLVALLLPRGTDAVTAILGTLFAGAAWLPLDPDGPEARIATILRDAAPSLLITLERHAGLAVVEGGPEVLLLDGPAPVHEPALPVAAGAMDPAYVIYTSGSTGQPNGVMIGRGALAHFVAGATARYGIESSDRVLQFAPLHFDACVEEIFLTLCAGATLVVRTDDMVQSLPRFLEAVGRYGITVLDLPTAFWQELAYAISSGAGGLPPSVRTVIIGGEAALPEPILRWRKAAGPSVTLFNTYGPTETTIVATSATIGGTDGTGPNGEEVPIGLPLPGMRAAIIGETGELHLIGDALALGYLGRPELTAKRFITLALPGGDVRAYRTGDLVMLRADGQIVFVGRVDDEFKISGHRVAPREIETALLRCAGVREAAVIGCVLPGGAKRLSAWLVADEPQPTPADLRRQLQTTLPASVIPSDLRFLDRLPRNRNGKIDRAALQRMPAPQAPEPVSAASPMEREILEVWRQVLGVRELSTRDDFFDLGGQSLQAIQVVNRLGVRIGREVSIAALFRHPTAMALASFLERESATDGQGGLGVLLPMVDQGDRPPLFCAHPAGGLSWCYLGLTRILPDQPLYGLQARGLETAEPLPESLEEMARDYLTRIRGFRATKGLCLKSFLR